jgi:hypothetical protein
MRHTKRHTKTIKGWMKRGRSCWALFIAIATADWCWKDIQHAKEKIPSR